MRRISSSSSSRVTEFMNYESTVTEFDPYKTVCRQTEDYLGLYIVLEGECFLSFDRKKITIPELLIDHREVSLNMNSLKESLSRMVIPSRTNHDIFKKIFEDDTVVDKDQKIRTLIAGDIIGDFEFSLRTSKNLFTITNSEKMLKVAFVSLSSLDKCFRHNQQENAKMYRMVLLKCDSYIEKDIMPVFFTNIQNQINVIQAKKHIKRPKTVTNDFEATLKLYELDVSNLVPSRVPSSMSILLKTKLAEGYWHKKIEERKCAQQMQNDIKINYFKSFHQQSARSRKQLEQLKRKETPVDETKLTEEMEKSTKTVSVASRARLVSTAKIPINHPSVANVWMILKAVNRFKDNSPLFQLSKIARSKEQLMKKTNTDNRQKKGMHNDEEIEFDPETGEKNLSVMERKMKDFVASLPHQPKNNGITSLKRYTVDGKSIPQVGGTILVRLKPCHDNSGHMHIHHHILPKDALSTLQKYRASKLGVEDS